MHVVESSNKIKRFWVIFKNSITYLVQDRLGGLFSKILPDIRWSARIDAIEPLIKRAREITTISLTKLRTRAFRFVC